MAAWLSDQDLLSLFLREPFAGITPGVYASLSDRQIVHVFLAPRDEDGVLIPEARQKDTAAGKLEAWRQERLDRAGQELPSLEDLEVPDEAFTRGVPMAFVLMFWQVWRSRGLTAAETLERWREYHGTPQP